MSSRSGTDATRTEAKTRFGRKRPVALGPHLKMANYLRATLPPCPSTADYTYAAQAALANPYLNDQLKTCVIAGAYHIVATETGNAGRLFTVSADQLIADYSAIAGYLPGEPSTDQGCDEASALNYWMTNGFANGTKPLGWMTVDATSVAEMKAALFLFGNLYLGAELPDVWVTTFLNKDRFVWDLAGPPVPRNGHCVAAVGYDEDGLKVDAWGYLGTVTWGALAKYFVPSVHGAAYVILTPDQLTKAQTRAPDGLAWTSLIKDFDAIGGTVPLPQPTSTPLVAVGARGRTVTLTEAQALVSAALRRSHPVLTQQQAISLANAGLAAGWPQPDP